MNLNFKTISEPTKAAAKWKENFNAFWPAYKAWIEGRGFCKDMSLKEHQAALKKYMPEMWDTYKHLCKLTNGDEVALKFLTGYCPPAYVSACAQAVIDNDEIQLVRNYDYDPNLLEGVYMLTKWNDKKVMGNADCLIGLVDGMNDAGLALSLTFGGRKEVGEGFGIPFILRYVLEFCSTTVQAVKALKKIPSHMSYNVTVVDKKGNIKTVYMAPDKNTEVTDEHFATNHQQKIDWPENAQFNNTIKRSEFIKEYLQVKNLSSDELAKAFLHKPLYNTQFEQGFGTLFTAEYYPKLQTAKMLWPQFAMELDFENFEEKEFVIDYVQSVQIVNNEVQKVEILEKVGVTPVATGAPFNWQEAVVESLVNVMAAHNAKKTRETLRKELLQDGQIAWEKLANYWNPYAETDF